MEHSVEHSCGTHRGTFRGTARGTLPGYPPVGLARGESMELDPEGPPRELAALGVQRLGDVFEERVSRRGRKKNEIALALPWQMRKYRGTRLSPL